MNVCSEKKREFFSNYVWPGLGLFGESYLLFSVGTLKPVWSMLYPKCFRSNDYYNDMEENEEVCSETLLHALTYNVVVGIIIGMVTIGMLSSRFIGRRLGSIVTASLMGFGGLMMTFATVSFANNPKELFTYMAIALFIFGIGVGGEYPLSASSASERAMEELQGRQGLEEQLQHDKDGDVSAMAISDRGKRVILIFSMQGMGIFVNSLILSCLLLITGQLGVEPNENEDDAKYYINQNGYDLSILLQIWQIIYAIGAIILVYVLISRILYLQESTVWAEDQQKMKELEKDRTQIEQFEDKLPMANTISGCSDEINQSAFKIKAQNETHKSKIIIMMRHYGLRLFGTSMSWLLWDVAFYGNKLFQSSFILALTGDSTTLFEMSEAATLNAFVALLGYYAAAYLIDKPFIGRRNLQQYGFIITGTLFLLCGTLRQKLSSKTLIMMYFASSFFGQCGPNCTTFLLPAEIFPTEIRATCHGFSASAGKVGALIAAICFHSVASDSDIFLWSAYCSFVAAILTFLFIPDTTTLDLYELDKKWRITFDSYYGGGVGDYIGPANRFEYLSFWERRNGAMHDFSRVEKCEVV